MPLLTIWLLVVLAWTEALNASRAGAPDPVVGAVLIAACALQVLALYLTWTRHGR